MSPGSLVLNPHFLCSKTDTSVLRKGRRTSRNQKNPPVKARVPLAGCWICCEWWAQWAGGKGQVLRNLFSDGKTVFGLDFHLSERASLQKLLQTEVVNIRDLCFISCNCWRLGRNSHGQQMEMCTVGSTWGPGTKFPVGTSAFVLYSSAWMRQQATATSVLLTTRSGKAWAWAKRKAVLTKGHFCSNNVPVQKYSWGSSLSLF